MIMHHIQQLALLQYINIIPPNVHQLNLHYHHPQLVLLLMYYIRNVFFAISLTFGDVIHVIVCSLYVKDCVCPNDVNISGENTKTCNISCNKTSTSIFQFTSSNVPRHILIVPDIGLPF